MKPFRQIISTAKKFEQRFIPPALFEDEDVARTAQTLTRMCALGIIIVTVWAVLWLLILPLRADRMIFILFGLVSVGLPLVIIRQGRLRLAIAILLDGLWLLITITVLTAGGTRAPAFTWYITVVLTAALLSGWRSAFNYALLTIGLGLVLAVLDPAGTVLVPFATPLSAWLSQSTSMMLACGSAYFILQRSYQDLRQAQTALAELRTAQQALRESEERFRLIASVTSDYTFSSRVSAQGELEHTLLTGAFEEITGYTPDEYMAIGGWQATVHPDDRAQDGNDLAVLRSNRSIITELRTIKKSGEVRWVRVHALPIWDEDKNRLFAINGGVRDITDSKRVEQSLRESEAKFRAIFELAPYEIIIQHMSGTVVIANHAFLDGVGYSLDQIEGKDILDPSQFSILSDLNKLSVIRQDLLANGRITNREIEFRHADGQRRMVLISSRVIHLSEEPQVLTIAIDVTQRKQAEESLRRSEAHLRALLDATTDVAFLMSRDGTLLTLNEAMAKPMGKTVAELVGQNAFDQVTSTVRTLRELQFAQVVETGEPVRWEDESPTGFWDNSVYPIMSPDGSVEAFAIYSRDITEQVRIEAELQHYTNQLEQLVDERTNALHRANDQLELVLNNTRDALAFANSKGDILVANPAFRAAFTEAGNHSLEFILWALASEEQIGLVGDAILKVIYESETCQVQAQIVVGQDEEKDVELTLIPVRMAVDGSMSGILLNGHDITQLKEIERFKARFVSDALHDLATPISGISTRLYILKRSPEKLADHVRALENQVQHLRNLLADLRILSQMDRQQIELNLEMCNINELVRRVFDTYEPVALEKQQTLVLMIAPDLPEARLDPRQIERVLVNLVSNAVNYTPQSKRISIETTLEEQSIVIRIADQGMGIEAENLPHIFERFYRTDGARITSSTGTGLGLAITKEIVELHGGTVTVTSEPRKGSTFTVQLPI